MKKKKHEAEKENSERWLLTYSDMITLLMLFFIVMYAMSKVDTAKYNALAEALSNVFTYQNEGTSGAGTGEGKIITIKPQNPIDVPLQSKKATSRVFDRAYDLIKSYQMQDKVKVRQEERGVVIQMGAELFFAPGKADLPENAGDTLQAVAAIAGSLKNQVQIEGHTDSSPPDPASGFHSNWELSSQRAINVLKVIESQGVDPKRLSAVAYGDTKPLAPNDTPEGRAYNRRIDVVILYDPQDFQN